MATLLCCAVPALLVLLGFGTTVAALVSAAPWIVVLSRNKAWVFVAAGLLILGSRLYVRFVVSKVVVDGASCPPALSRATRAAWWTSVVVYSVGLFIAYLLGPLFLWGRG